MAQGRRVERLASLLRREISDLLTAGIRDARVHQGMVSVTRVDVAGDLQHSKIFVSVYGSDEEQRQAIEGLKAATPYVRGELGRRLRLRRMPELLFVLDRGLERGTAVLGLLRDLERERHLRESASISNQSDTLAPAMEGADAEPLSKIPEATAEGRDDSED
ncbi:MAG: Ribosome-binding factor [Cyanobacteriota bacterium]|jgi:ribosome-binding factor A